MSSISSVGSPLASAVSGIRSATDSAARAAVVVAEAPRRESMAAELQVSDAGRDLASGIVQGMEAKSSLKAQVTVAQTADEMSQELLNLKA